MGGDKQQAQQPFFGYQPEMQKLPYQTEGDQSQPGYSDEHSRVMMEDQRKRSDALMMALSRLGVVDQLAPSGMIPRMPYRPIEQNIGF